MIVINNYFSGVLKRGIPIYTEELVLQMKKDSMQVCELTCQKSYTLYLLLYIIFYSYSMNKYLLRLLDLY